MRTPSDMRVMRFSAVMTAALTTRHTPFIVMSAPSLTDLACRVAKTISDGRAHVEPTFLSGDDLNACRTDMANVLSQALSTGGASNEFQSLQTDLLHPDFRNQPGVPFGSLLNQLEELRVALADSTGRAFMEGGGLHLMHYPVGSKFMRHVDEDPAMFEPIRNSISFLIYLTDGDDWSEDDGGALRIFDNGDEPRRVLPVSGTLVVYDSTTEHEVLETRRERVLISGRFKELDEDWQRGR